MSKIQFREIDDFLLAPTPLVWIDAALNNQTIMLIDHAHCEKKAAVSALNLIHHYPQHCELMQKMSRIAREEMRHFEQVLKLMQKRGITFANLSPARYASGLRQHIRHDNNRLMDILIIGAFIEARSCERFKALAPYLDIELKSFYESLLKSESRHFLDYINFAASLAAEPITDRIQFFADIEAQLITTEDTHFRFHSGIPL